MRSDLPGSGPPGPPDELPETVDHYRLLRKIGQGGMGVVYEAEDVKLRRIVALKFLPPALTHAEENRSRFIREAQAASSLDHPNVCTIHEISEMEDGRLFICMAHCPGESLLARLRRGPLEPSEAVRIAIEVARGLARAHEGGIVHRDIKPANVMLGDRGEVKILDFGVAKLAGSTSLTGSGTVVGTLAYMAPEQAEARPVDHRADIWALGVVLYEMISGRLPFHAESTGALLHAICNKVPATLPPRDDLPPGLLDVIDRCLKKDPEDRYASVPELLRDLSSVQGALTAPGEARGFVHRTRRGLRGIEWVVAAAALVAIVWGVMVFREIRGSPAPREGAPSPEVKTLAVLGFDNLKDPEDSERLGQILQELVITDLSEVPSLRVLSSQRLFDLQQQLGYARRTRIDDEVAGEVARRAGANLMLDGTIMQLAGRWTLTCQLIDPHSGTVLRSQRIDGADVYDMVDSLSGQIRSDLGLAAGEAGTIDVAVREKTTTSMEAYRHYLAGMDDLYASALDRAIARFDSAVAIDPRFNQAYYWMAMAQWWSDDEATQQGRDSIARILDNRRYTTERERLLAEGALALIDRRFTDALSIHEQLAARYPDDKEVLFALGLAYASESRLNRDKVMAAFQRAIDLDFAFVLPYREVADIHLWNREYEKVAELARNLITIRPDSPIGYRYLVDAAIGKGDSAQVEVALQQALQHHETPEELQALYYQMGLACNRTGNQVQSELYTRKALAQDPDTGDHRLYAQLGDALLNQGRTEEARAAYAKGLELNPLGSWCLGGLWYVAIRQGDYGRAVEFASRLVAMRPQEPRRHAELIESYVQAGRLADADSTMERALAAIPSTAGKLDLLSQIANLYRSRLYYDRSEAVLRRAAAMEESSTAPYVHIQLAWIANGKRDYARAEQLARRALAIEPRNEEALRELSFAQLHAGKIAPAIESARQRSEVNPGLGSVYTSLLEACVASGRYAEADSVLEVALEADRLPKDRTFVLFECAGYHRRAGRYAKAEELYRRLLDLAPGDPHAQDALGRLYEIEGRLDDAVRQYRTVLESRSEDTDALRGMGRVHLRREDYAEAEKWYGRALRVEETDPWTLRGLGYVFSESGRYRVARDWAERALDRDRSFLSKALLAWVLVAGDLDVRAGGELAREALTEPPIDDPTDEWRTALPFAPLPEHTLGVAYLEQKDLRSALPYLEIAAELRPEDGRIANDLRIARGEPRPR